MKRFESCRSPWSLKVDIVQKPHNPIPEMCAASRHLEASEGQRYVVLLTVRNSEGHMAKPGLQPSRH